MRRDFKGYVTPLRRTKKPVRYHIIDFGLSKRYNPFDGPPRDYYVMGGDKTIPELQRPDELCDPFAVDVYFLGNVMREAFLMVRLLLPSWT
jgi:hypothetical protein